MLNRSSIATAEPPQALESLLLVELGNSRRALLVSIGPPILIAIVAAAIRIAFFQHAPVFFEGDARGYLIRALELSYRAGFPVQSQTYPGLSPGHGRDF